MIEEIEFPQADPALQYIVRQVAKIEGQYACNAGYHRDHKDLRTRIDKMDVILSELNQRVKLLDVSAIATVQAQVTATTDEYLVLARELNAAGMQEIKSASGSLRDELCASEHMLRGAKNVLNVAIDTFGENQNQFENLMQSMADQVTVNAKNAVDEAFEAVVNRNANQQIKRYGIVLACGLVIGLLVGVYLSYVGLGGV